MRVKIVEGIHAGKEGLIVEHSNPLVIRGLRVAVLLNNGQLVFVLAEMVEEVD